METDNQFKARVEKVTGMLLEEIPPGDIFELRPDMQRVARYLPGGGREYVYDRGNETWRHCQVLDGTDEDHPRGNGEKWTLHFRRPDSTTYERIEVVDFAITRNGLGWANEAWLPSDENGPELVGGTYTGAEITVDRRGLTFLVRRDLRA